MLKSAQIRLHTVVFLWGFTGILGKLITVKAQVLVFYRMFFAALFLYVFIRLVKKQSMKVNKKVLLQLLGIGGLMGFHWLSFFYSIKISNVSIALACISTGALFASIIEPLVYRRKIDPYELLTGLVIVACIAMIFNVQFKYKWGIIFGLICAFLSALFTVLNGKMFGKTSSENVIFYEIFGGWLIVNIFIASTGNWMEVTHIGWHDLLLLLLLASLFTAYTMLESVRLMEFISPFTLALTVNLEPVYGIIMAFFIFGQSEHMDIIFYLASLVMIAAIVTNGVLKAKRRKMLA